jgi:hypothetical protein
MENLLDGWRGEERRQGPHLGATERVDQNITLQRADLDQAHPLLVGMQAVRLGVDRQAGGVALGVNPNR